MVPKRKPCVTPSRASKKRRTQAGEDSKAGTAPRGPFDFRDIETVREQAEPYRLCTAKVFVEDLTSRWSVGKNRGIRQSHVRSLCRLFVKQGLQRGPPEHHLLVCCEKKHVDAMVERLAGNATSSSSAPDASVVHADLERRMRLPAHPTGGDAGSDTPWPSFDAWKAVAGEKLELMAGQHRVEALKAYLRQTCDEEKRAKQSWWICDFYDKDALPDQLNVKLRENRRDATLPDSHGQIWMELITLQEGDRSRFEGNNARIQVEMLDCLGLAGTPTHFPMRRLVTLWKNTSWKDRITRWCRIPLGEATFNISNWDEMARRRVDEFWFGMLDDVADLASRVSSGDSQKVLPEDWAKLGQLPLPRRAADVNRLFYPSEPDPGAGAKRARSSNFLTLLDEATYDNACRFALDNPEVEFEHLNAMLRRRRAQAKTVSAIMTHVSHWLNNRPTPVGDRDNNKPPIRDDFVPALRHRYEDRAEEEALRLQQTITTFVCDRNAEFNNAAISALLSGTSDVDDDVYLERFKHQVWKDLLVLVRLHVGPSLQGRSVSRYNSEDPVNISSKPVSAITQVMCNAIATLAEVAKNPSLSKTSSLDELYEMIEPVVMGWAEALCDRAIRAQAPDGSVSWSKSTLDYIHREKVKFSTLLGERKHKGSNKARVSAAVTPVRQTPGESLPGRHDHPDKHRSDRQAPVLQGQSAPPARPTEEEEGEGEEEEEEEGGEGPDKDRATRSDRAISPSVGDPNVQEPGDRRPASGASDLDLGTFVDIDEIIGQGSTGRGVSAPTKRGPPPPPPPTPAPTVLRVDRPLPGTTGLPRTTGRRKDRLLTEPVNTRPAPTNPSSSKVHGTKKTWQQKRSAPRRPANRTASG